jgi:hypothetical protein
MRRPPHSAAALTAACAILTAAAPALAQNTSMTAELDRQAVAPGEPFVYQVTLSVGNENVEDYRPPDFKGLRVLSTPQFPSRSTQMQIGGGQTMVQNSYSWRYELMVPAGTSSGPTIGAAHARVGGREVRSNTLPLRLGAAGATPPPPVGRAQRGMSPFDMDPFGMLGGRQAAEPPAPPAGATFLRAVADRTRVAVGEQVTVAWYLYTTQNQDKIEPTAEPRTDGFWSEDIPSTAPGGRLPSTQETVNGRPYQVALLQKKALFPLRPGKLTVTALEANVAHMDFFAVRTQHLKAEPVTIDVTPLPREGEPPGFDPANVGKYTIAARADRTAVAVGEAVTLTVEIRGTGNVRNVRPPALPHLDGWKSYEPRTSVNVDAGEALSGVKTLEILMLPERAGTTVFPALELPTFDPEAKRYVVARSEPVRLEVTGEAAAAARPGAPGAGAPAGPAVDNVIGAEVRPIRARTSLRRDMGVSLLRSGVFTGILVVPPVALALAVLVDRLRERLSEESRRVRRHMRSQVRKRLGAAEAHRDAGRTAAFYIEIERVLREVLSARLGQPVSGLRMDELADVLRARGMAEADVARIVSELEACDQARFAPGAETADGAALGGALERAGELIVAIEKAPLREGARA